ncbi:hypothetical protein VTG60DRAFT_1874 [Thermothelomyces hinnuleus]
MATTTTDTPQTQVSSLSQEGCYVALTSSPLNIQSVIDRVRSPQAGAIVLFAGPPQPLPTPPPPLILFLLPPFPSPFAPLPFWSPWKSDRTDPTNTHDLRLGCRHDPGLVRQQAGQGAPVHGVRAARAAHHAGHCHRAAGQARAQGHRHGPPPRRGARRRGEHPHRRVGAPSAGRLARRRGGARGVQGARGGVEARGV